MVSTPKKHHNGTFARQIVIKSLAQTARLLTAIGYPLYTLFSLSSKTLAFLKDTTGLIYNNFKRHIDRKILENKLQKKTDVKASRNSSQLKNLRGVLTENHSGLKNYLWLTERKIHNHLRGKSLSFKLEIYNISTVISQITFKIFTFLKISAGLARKLVLSEKLISRRRRYQIKKGLSEIFSSGQTNAAIIQIHNVADKLKPMAKHTPQLRPHDLRFTLLKLKLKYIPPLANFKRNLLILKPKLVLYALGGVLVGIGILLIVFWALVMVDLPKAGELTTRPNYEVSTKIYDRNGILLYKIYKNKNRTPVALENIPLNVRLATLAIEDAEFYSHPGFSIRGIMRSLLKNVENGELAGGSTITQQLVKNVFFTPEKTVVRKLKEIVMAMQVERQYSKDEILEMYLNEVSYGGTAYGIQEASQMYFSKDVDKLSLAEAALLAGLPKSPTQFSPFGTSPEKSYARQKQTLKLMRINGFITPEQEESTLQEKVVFSLNTIDIKAPHFVMYVREVLENKYGKEMVEKGGLEVTTTLDYDIQQMAEKAVSQEIDRLNKLNVNNGAALVLNPSSGEILAMVGSRNYFDSKNDGNVNITTTLQSPGSSIKVINYAYALSHGFTPASILDDTPVTYNIAGSPPYTPKNYDGKFRGKIPLRSALAESRNIPAVKVLQTYGVNNMIALGRSMGITTWEEQGRFGPSLTLGGGDVRLIDLAQVYATVANYGKKPGINAIMRVATFKGQKLEELACSAKNSTQLMASANTVATDLTATGSAYTLKQNADVDCQYEQVLDPRVSYMITDILKDNNARTPAFGSNSQLVISNHKEIAVKTGTSNELRDNLTIGYNQFYLVAIWVGNNDNSPMSRIASGITGAAPIFNKIMTSLVNENPNHDWEIPEGLIKLPICSITGTLSCSGCTTKEEWFLVENQPTQACSEEWLKELRERSEKKNDESDDEKDNKRNRRFFIF